MKKQSIIIIALCVLVAAVIALSVLGVIGPQDGSSLAGSSKCVPTVTAPNTMPSSGDGWDHSEPTTP